MTILRNIRLAGYEIKYIKDALAIASTIPNLSIDDEFGIGYAVDIFDFATKRKKKRKTKTKTRRND